MEEEGREVTSPLFMISGISNETGRIIISFSFNLTLFTIFQTIFIFQLNKYLKFFVGLDCFSISVLHLLAQTDLIHCLRVCELPHNSFEKVQDFISKKPCDNAATISKKVDGDGSNLFNASTLCKNAR